MIIATLALSLLMIGANEPATPVAKPNIILILADDLGYGDLGCYGQKLIQTPHLDRMATEGMRFRQFYAGSTVCAPSRCVLMTGLHTGHCRVRGNAGAKNTVAQMLRPDDVTMAEVLQQAGYRTALIGKWGLGLQGDDGIPTRQGFDEFFGFLSQHHAHNHYPDFLWRGTERERLPNIVVPIGGEGGGYATERVQYAGDLFAAEALKFVERQQDKPFFLYLALTVPHANNERSRELKDGQEVPDYGPYADRDWSNPHKGQAAMITRMDQQIGQLFAKLRELKLDRRTLVCFSSDNGPHKEGGNDPEFFDANGPYSGYKRSLKDGGIRVPFIAWQPGVIPAGVVSEHVGYFGDLSVTFAELAGTAMPTAKDGLSLLPVLRGRSSEQPQHAALYWEFYEGGVSQAVLLDGRWKGVRLKSQNAPIELYDQHHDSAEITNVAVKHPDLVARIGQLMQSEHIDNEHWQLPKN